MSLGVLNVIGGADRGKRFDLTLAETRIGRGADQDVVLSDIAVSRRHITVHQEGPRYRLRDLGSGNGTLVNGQRIDTVLLNEGDHIELGNTVLRFNQQGVSASPQPGYAPPPSTAGFGPPPTASNFGGAAPAPYVPPAQPYIPPAQPYIPPAQPFLQAAPMPLPPAPMPLPMQGAATQAPQMIGVATVAPIGPGTMSPMPAPAARSVAPRVSAGRRSVSRGPLSSPLKLVLVLGGMGVVCALGATVIMSRTVFAKPQIVASDAEESYKQGLRLFGQTDYEGAKINFNDAATQAPDAPEPKRYVKQCDAELHARGALKAAERSAGAHHYLEAVTAIQQVEDGTLAHEQALRMKKELSPRAAAEEVDNARRLTSDPAAMQARLNHALELDPNNADARALLPKIKGGKPVVVATVKEPASEPHQPTKEPTTAPVVKEPKTPSTPSVSGGEPKGATMGLYKNKDFAGAVRSARLESMSQTGKQLEKTQALMNQLKAVQAAFDRASAEEASRPSEAVKDYNEAMQLDQKMTRGVHGAFFKQKIGKVQLATAQQQFTAGKFDQAYQSVQLAQKFGAGDGGMLKQLESKANELVQKGQGMQKSNVNQAKTYWRMVCKMVPASSPTYAKAYGLINSNSGPTKDEDEN